MKFSTMTAEQLQLVAHELFVALALADEGHFVTIGDRAFTKADALELHARVLKELDRREAKAH